MRGYLVVANQTLQRADLRYELCERLEARPSWIYLRVPDIRAADYQHVPAAAAGVLPPSMTWWVTDYGGPAP